MRVRVRFFARFRELLGSERAVEMDEGISLAGLIRMVAAENREGYEAIFDEGGSIRRFVIVMKNGARMEPSEAEHTLVTEGDEIAVFPPVAGG
jgi:molybdopterin synthase sulfur carrier subunit